MTLSVPTLNYNSYVSQTANLIVISSNDPNYQTMLPGMIDYAEQRIWREADFLRQQVTDPTTSVTSGIRTVSTSTTFGVFITVDEVNIISSNSSTRYPVVPVSRAYLDATFPSGSNITGIPEFFAMTSDTRLILGPAPDQPYSIEFIGVQRPNPLSASNSSTYLTQYAPDLFIAASMIFAFGYMRDFGGQADNPQATQSWENQYKQLFQSAQAEAGRAKHESQGWTPYSVSPQTTPPRT
jgi:hypothetical protein